MIHYIIPIGTSVKIKNTKHEGIINNAIISINGLTYRIAYWNDDEYNEIVLYEHEFSYDGERFDTVKTKE